MSIDEVAGAHRPEKLIKLAILAVGGQGGGVLTNWIVALARNGGYQVQSTSVAGVAQRTGATIYYIEISPGAAQTPVFALSPSAGDVDIVIAAEWMEAGRAIVRGFVTPDRTTLIASTHRIHAVVEKQAPGDGRIDPGAVHAAAEAAALRLICHDLERVASDAGSVISASLFGALAASGALPFACEQFEAVIRDAGRDAEASVRAFAAAVQRVNRQDQHVDVAPAPASAEPIGPVPLLRDFRQLQARVLCFPPVVSDFALHGLAHVVDYQDLQYGQEYLARLDRAVSGDAEEQGYRFSVAAAKHLARALAYDDIVRVADLKTRSGRRQRILDELKIDDNRVVHVTEYFHPRIEELCSTLPTPLGRWIETRPGVYRWLDRRVNKGRRVRSDAVLGFSILWLLSALKPWRRQLLRHHREIEHIDRWFALALHWRSRDYDRAVEILESRRLIKGYSDTHARGMTDFDQSIARLTADDRESKPAA